jgi:hypothetical protein
LLTRNLHEVLGENDPTRRRAASDEIFTEGCMFHGRNGVYHGQEEIFAWPARSKQLTVTFDIK